MAKKFLVRGDITKDVTVDAIVTLINSGGMWLGGVDGAIRRVAGSIYHDQAAEVMRTEGLLNGQVVIAKRNGKPNMGSFDDVIFVIDDLIYPLGILVRQALLVAKNEGYKSVALPLMRTGVMLGVVEPDVYSVAEEMRKGMELAEKNGANMDIYIVVYDDPQAIRLLASSLQLKE